jgi:hypothetical protein
MHDLLVEGSPQHYSIPYMAVENPLHFINSINQSLDEMTPQSLSLNHWPYLVLLFLFQHSYWRRRCEFDQLPCHTLALPLVLVSMVFDRFLFY